MRLTTLSGSVAFALFSAAFVPAASADGIQPSSATVRGDDVLPDTPGRDHSRTLQSDAARVRGGDDLDRLYRQMVAGRSHQGGNLFQAGASVSQPSGPSSSAPSRPGASVTGPTTQPVPAPTLQVLPQPGTLQQVQSDLLNGVRVTTALGQGTQEELVLAHVGAAGQPLPTPEPASLILLGSGLAAAGVLGARTRKKVAVTREL